MGFHSVGKKTSSSTTGLHVQVGSCGLCEYPPHAFVPPYFREHHGCAGEAVHALIPAIAPGLLRPIQAHRVERIRSEGRDFQEHRAGLLWGMTVSFSITYVYTVGFPSARLCYTGHRSCLCCDASTLALYTALTRPSRNIQTLRAPLQRKHATNAEVWTNAMTVLLEIMDIGLPALVAQSSGMGQVIMFWCTQGCRLIYMSYSKELNSF